ncbi:SEA (Seh1-associated) complex subunit [Mycoemilia scoparia]|uniref:SEA (Seh1-associated) complex subunit n=1 Tax=Mycoemilia scoparia TaxID=417184 RepID=A0A9W8DPP4_9FUNG|nr:SEA (Seh1-associated) complex subunit [Mycoemilia scoparia]
MREQPSSISPREVSSINGLSSPKGLLATTNTRPRSERTWRINGECDSPTNDKSELKQPVKQRQSILQKPTHPQTTPTNRVTPFMAKSISALNSAPSYAAVTSGASPNSGGAQGKAQAKNINVSGFSRSKSEMSNGTAVANLPQPQAIIDNNSNGSQHIISSNSGGASSSRLGYRRRGSDTSRAIGPRGRTMEWSSTYGNDGLNYHTNINNQIHQKQQHQQNYQHSRYNSLLDDKLHEEKEIEAGSHGSSVSSLTIPNPCDARSIGGYRYKGTKRLKFRSRWLNIAAAPDGQQHAAMVCTDSLIAISVDEFSDKGEIHFGGRRHDFTFDFKDVIWDPSRYIITGSNSGVICAWDPENPRNCVNRLENASRPIIRLAAKPGDPNVVIAAYSGMGVHSIDIREPRPRKRSHVTSSNHTFNDVHCNPVKSHEIATIDNNGRVMVWDTRTKKQSVNTILAHGSATAHAVAWHPDGSYIASGGDDRHIKIWDVNVDYQKLYEKPYCDISTPYYVRRIAWRPGHKTQLASFSADLDHRVYVWDTREPYHHVMYQDHVESNTTGFLWYDENRLWSCTLGGDFIDCDVRSGMTRTSKYLSTGSACFSPFHELAVATYQDIPAPKLQSGENPDSLKAEEDAQFNESDEACDLTNWDVYPHASFVQDIGEVLDDLPTPDRIVYLAENFVLDGTDVYKSCQHNYNAAISVECYQIAKTWQLLQNMFGYARPILREQNQGQGVLGASNQPGSTETNKEQESGPKDPSRNSYGTKSIIGFQEHDIPENTDPSPDTDSETNQLIKHGGSSGFGTQRTIDICTKGRTTKQDCKYILDLCEYYCDQGNPQMSVTIALVMSKFINLIKWTNAQGWFSEYIGYLDRLQATTAATWILNACPFEAVKDHFFDNMGIKWSCGHCNEKLEPINGLSRWYCVTCNRASQTCSICLLPVKGRYIWCQGCGHGGHAQHINEWFSEHRNEVCPAGCGHQCQFYPDSLDDEVASVVDIA